MEQSPMYDKYEFNRQFERKSKITDPGIYIIACEGTKDEPGYIKEFVKKETHKSKSVHCAERRGRPWLKSLACI